MNPNDYLRAVAADLPRFLRSDLTRLTEEAVKYHGTAGYLLASGIENAAELHDLAVAIAYHLSLAREAVEVLSVAVSQGGAPPQMGPGTASGPETEGVAAHKLPQVAGQAPDGSLVVDTGGKGTLLVDALFKVGLASSSVKARLGIRNGLLKVNGAFVVNPGQMLEPGRYSVELQDAPASTVVVR